MDKITWPWLLLNLHLLSGLILLPLVHRFRSQHGKQWLKYLVFYLLVNGIWALITFAPEAFPWLGYLLAGLALGEFLASFRSGSGSILRPVALLSLFCFLLILAGFLLFLHTPAWLWLYSFYLVVIFDATAQVTGQLTGKRKLLPRISPGKTLEGLLAALLITLVSSLLIHKYLLPEGILWFPLSICILAAAFLGDLLASWHKRSRGIKNYSNFIPGHGGFLDRFDSWLTAGALLGLTSLLGLI